MNIFQSIESKNKFLDEIYFYQEDFPTFKNQIDNYLKNVTKKKAEPEAKNDSKPKDFDMVKKEKKIEPDTKIPKKGELKSVMLVNDLLEKKNYYLRSLFRDNESLFTIQSHFINYEYQMNKINNSIEGLFSLQIPEDQQDENGRAIEQIFIEGPIFTDLKKVNEEIKFDEIDEAQLNQIRKKTKEILQKANPGLDMTIYDQKSLAVRKGSLQDEYELTNSQLNNEDFMKKIQELETLKEKNIRSMKKIEEKNEYEIPQIEVKSEKIESIKEVEEELDEYSSKKVVFEEDDEIKIKEKEYHYERDNRDISGEHLTNMRDLKSKLIFPKNNSLESIYKEKESDDERISENLNKQKKNKYIDPLEKQRQIDSFVQSKIKESKVFKRSIVLNDKRRSLSRKKSLLEKELSSLKNKLEEKKNQSITYSRNFRTRESSSVNPPNKMKNSKIIIQEINKLVNRIYN
jgi:hypothetical protein